MKPIEIRSGGQTYSLTEYRKKEDIIPIVRGSRGPCRFWERSLTNEKELSELSRQGWIIDKTEFKLNPNDFPTNG